MEWTCNTCEQQATATDWRLLATIGWRLAQDGSVLCSICAKAAAGLPGLPAATLLAPSRRGTPAP